MPVKGSRRARAARGRKRRMDRVEHDLSAEQWTMLTAAWGGCAYCGETDKPLQRDCVLALSRGGRYTLDNIVPACRSCNTSKCNDEVTGWLRRKRLDERAFLTRHLEINTALALRFRTEGAEHTAPDRPPERLGGDEPVDGLNCSTTLALKFNPGGLAIWRLTPHGEAHSDVPGDRRWEVFGPSFELLVLRPGVN